MRTIYVVAHPEATHHVEGLIGGWYDSELTISGLGAAATIAGALRAEIPPGAEVELVSSDLRRTVQTAAAIADVLGAPPVLDSRLREKSYGEVEGQPAGHDRRFVPPPTLGDRMDHDEGVPGAETRAVFAKRVYAAMTDVMDRSCDHQIIVTHGGATTFVVAAWIQMPIESLGYVTFKTPPGSITTLHEGDVLHDRQVVRLGDTSHLSTSRR